jgi:hypothetical protein
LDLVEPQPTSQIAQERLGLAAPGWLFLVLAVGLALLAGGLALAAGMPASRALAVERAVAGQPGALAAPLGLAGARALAAGGAAVAVLATALAGRRLFHNDGVGLLAAALVALDPAALASGRLAAPQSLALAGVASALACFLAQPTWARWLGAALLATAALLDPRAVGWGIPLALLALLRGHIYAAPRHLGLAALQAIGAPAAGALLHLAYSPTWSALPCPAFAPAALVLLEAPDFGGVAAVHNPVTWFGGLGAVLLMAGAALWTVVRQVRMARLPGRAQLRLAVPLPALHARVLWLLVLALAVPFPEAWLPLFAIALAAGVAELADDAPGFGLAVGLVVLVFAVLALARAWPAVAATGAVEGAVHGLVPWARMVACP